nr:methyl-accepting chemotaxis protein [Variovorax boronicumulans]
MLQRLSLFHKFAILALLGVLMCLLPAWLYTRGALQTLAQASHEARGAAPLAALNRTVQWMQVHRGLSASMLSGNEVLAARRPAARDAVVQALAAADARFAEAQVPAAQRQAWAQLRQTWQELEAQVAARGVEAAQSTARHTAMIASAMRIGDELLQSFRLMVEPEPALQALIQASLVQSPMLGEKLGVMRAQGAAFLARGELPPPGRALLQSLRDRVQELQGEALRNFARASAGAPALRQALEAPVRQQGERIDATLQLAERELLQAATLSLPGQAYFDEFTRTIDGLYELNALAMASLDAALQQRIVDQRRTLLWTGLSLALALLLAGGLMAAFARSITRPMAQAVALADAVAQGDLAGPPIAHGCDEVGRLIAALLDMRAQLTAVVVRVRNNADGVATASAEIAQGNNDLSARTESQASALQQTAASMEQMTATVRQNADTARQASALAVGASSVAEQGGAVVAQMVQTMQGIHAASGRIADIIGVIDAIAFQTNILALNAAVEAARAGEHGRGFAVVASEVRLLAKRSAEAAKQIKALITDSVQGVDAGHTLAGRAGTTMQELLAAVRRVSDLIASISAASQEQSQGVAQVGEAIAQMDQTTQQNAALVEQMAAAASSLRSQAGELVEGVAVFRTQATHGALLLEAA